MKHDHTYHSLRLWICSVCLLLTVQALPAKTLFEQGNTAYQEKQYEKAAELYKQVIGKGEGSSTVYYNLGNSYFRLKQFPKAILNYEKALKQDPGNDKIEHNLKMAYNKSLTKIETSRDFFVLQFIGRLIHEFGSRNWAVVFLFFFWMSIAFFLVYFRKTPGTRSFYWKIAFFTGVLSVVFFFVAKHRYEEQTSYTHAIVLQPAAELKTDPVKNSKTQIAIEAGNKVQLLDRDADWYKIKLSNGKQGWIDQKSLATI